MPKTPTLVVLAMLMASVAEMFAAPQSALAHEPVVLGEMLIGWDIGDLPANPTIKEQIDAGQKQLVVIREDDSGLDSNQEVHDYFNQIVAKLLAGSDQKPPYPIEVHVSSVPIDNAEAMPGGQIVLYERMFDTTDDESQLVAVIAHETAHELHHDFMTFWTDYKTDRALYGSGGVIEQSVKIEASADETGARLMYAAGWDPGGMVELFKRFHKFGVMARRGAPDVRSTHPDEAKRAQPIEELIAKLPPKEGLIKDSPQFQELKQKY